MQASRRPPRWRSRNARGAHSSRYQHACWDGARLCTARALTLALPSRNLQDSSSQLPTASSCSPLLHCPNRSSNAMHSTHLAGPPAARYAAPKRRPARRPPGASPARRRRRPPRSAPCKRADGPQEFDRRFILQTAVAVFASSGVPGLEGDMRNLVPTTLGKDLEMYVKWYTSVAGSSTSPPSSVHSR